VGTKDTLFTGGDILADSRMKTMLNSIKKRLIRLHALVYQFRPSKCVPLVHTPELRNASLPITLTCVPYFFENQVFMLVNLNLFIYRHVDIFGVYEQSWYRYRMFHTRLDRCGIQRVEDEVQKVAGGVTIESERRCADGKLGCHSFWSDVWQYEVGNEDIGA
jgi:hypothetical protein